MRDKHPKPDDEATVKRRAGLIANRLNGFFAKASVFDPGRFPAVASLIAASESRRLPLETLLNIAKVPVWIFAVDTLIDERRLPLPELRRRLDAYEEIVKGKREVSEAEDPHGAALAHIRKLVQSRPLYAELRDLWEETYVGMIQGMLAETCESDKPVSMRRYLEYGQYSIGSPMHVVSSWILQSEASTLERKDELVRMMKLSGICIRLANDLRTYEKERREQKINAIFIKEKELISAGMDVAEAVQASRRYVASMLQAFMDEFLALTNDDDPLIAALRTITRLSVEFYRERDFHTSTALHMQSHT